MSGAPRLRPISGRSPSSARSPASSALITTGASSRRLYVDEPAAPFDRTGTAAGTVIAGSVFLNFAFLIGGSYLIVAAANAAGTLLP